jgi:hypothetical protein
LLESPSESVSERPAELDQEILLMRMIENIRRDAAPSHSVFTRLKARGTGSSHYPLIEY